MDFDPGGHYISSSKLQHRKTIFENVFSKDDPDSLIGYIQIDSFRELGSVFDDRPDAAEQIDAMEDRIAEKAAVKAAAEERAKREAKGEFTFELTEKDEAPALVSAPDKRLRRRRTVLGDPCPPQRLSRPPAQR